MIYSSLFPFHGSGTGGFVTLPAGAQSVSVGNVS
jgi:hypothetical protein